MWMDDQISQDFAPFERDGITQDMLDQTMLWNAKWYNLAYPILSPDHLTMVRYRVVDSQIYRSKRVAFRKLYDDAVIWVLKEILSKYTLPDVDFIYFSQDGPLTPFIAPDQSKPTGPILAGVKKEEFENVILTHNFITPCPSKSDWVSGKITEGYSWDFTTCQIEKTVPSSPWEKKLSKAIWRGRATDGIYTEDNYRSIPRGHLVALSKEFQDLIDAAFTSWNWKRNEFLQNVPAIGPLKPHMAIAEHMNFKYQIAVDGAAGTFPGLAWRLLSNCLCFKVHSSFYQWFEKGLEPHIHYIPIKSDLSDLIQKTKMGKRK